MIYLYMFGAILAVVLVTPLLLGSRTLRNAMAYVEGMNGLLRRDLLGQVPGDDDTYHEALEELDEDLALLAGVPKSSPFRVGPGRNPEAAVRDMIRNAGREDPPKLQRQNHGRDVVMEAILIQAIVVKATIQRGRSAMNCLDSPINDKILRGCWIIKVHLLADPGHHPDSLQGFKAGIVRFAQSADSPSFLALADLVEDQLN